MKNARQQKILEIIEKYDIDTQDTLIKRLGEEGYIVTQTTISRDIRQLNLIKGISANGTYKYVAPGSVLRNEGKKQGHPRNDARQSSRAGAFFYSANSSSA